MLDYTVFNKLDTSQLSFELSKLSEKQTDNTNKLIQSKDRVDISLREYLDLKDRIKIAEIKLKEDEKFFQRLGFPGDINVVTNTVRCYVNDDPLYCGLRKRYRIEFEAEQQL